MPYGRDLRVSRDIGIGEKWNWRRGREGWPVAMKAGSEGAKMVRE